MVCVVVAVKKAGREIRWFRLGGETLMSLMHTDPGPMRKSLGFDVVNATELFFSVSQIHNKREF